ncbi:MAG: hypothetical protein ChlgKO_07000 [Chlamydiales bacterium]
MKIFPKLLISFLIISIIPLCSITYLVYSHFKKIEIEDALKDLSEISKARIAQVEHYFKTFENTILFIGRTIDVGEALKKLSAAYNKKEDNTAVRKNTNIDELFQLMTELSGVNDVYLLDTDGNMVYSFRKNEDLGESIHDDQFNKTEIARVFSKIMITINSDVSEFKISPFTNDPVIFVGAPVIENDVLLGVMICQLPADVMYNFFHDYTHLGETGEVLMGAEKSDGIIFVNPIRYHPDAAFNLEIPFGSDAALPMQKAVKGVNGKGISVDYRNHKVLATWSYFNALNLGIVVKMDLDEVLLEVNQLGKLLTLVAAITALAVTLIAIVLADAISKPIILLQKAAGEIGLGHLDTPINTNHSDEVGDLAREIQKMAETLGKSTTSIEELNQEIARSKELVRSKAELISRVSHELRTPLTSILTGLQFALNEISVGESSDKRNVLEIAHKNGVRLNELVDDIVKYQKVQSDKDMNSIEKKELDLHRLIESALSTCQEAITKKGITVTKKFQSDSLMLFCNKDQILLVLTNLLDNAVKFTDKGTVTIHTSLKEGEIEVKIEDSGIGVSEDDFSKLFQSFRELNMDSLDKKQGKGLSLAICKEIIGNHKGKIWAESKEGAGMIFAFTLPQNA